MRIPFESWLRAIGRITVICPLVAAVPLRATVSDDAPVTVFTSALLIGEGNQRGTLEPAKRVGFVVWSANPLECIRNTTTMRRCGTTENWLETPTTVR